MAFLRKSLSEDSVDRYSHTWAFLFLLLISLITLLMPLSPSMNLRNFASSGRINAKGDNEGRPPTFKPACWIPSEFTFPMVNYVHQLCSSAYNAIVQGRNSSTASLIIKTEDPIPLMRSSEGIGERILFATEKSRKSHEGRENLAQRAKDLFCFTTPLFIFILAVFLRLPHAVWSLLSTCCGCINVDQTLAAALTAHSMDSEGRESVYEEIALILKRLRKKKLGLLYLLMKLLMVVVVCLGISAANSDFLRETEDIQKKLREEKSNEETGMAFLSRQFRGHNMSVENLQEFPEVLFCSFEIIQLQNVRSFIVQCFFTPEEVSHDDRSEPGAKANRPRGGNNMSEEQILLMYKAIFTSVWSVFILLAIFNISSLLIWCLTLLLPCYRSKMGLSDEASIDLTFVMAMARQNASCVVTTELIKRSPKHQNDGKS